MPGASTTQTLAERLAHDLFDGADRDPLAVEVAGWLAGSARFRAFATAYREKIRKKLRGARDPEARRDVRVELRTAQLLLPDRRMELTWEAYGSARGGPDFTVTLRRERSFNLEVTRLRGTPTASSLERLILAKLRQLPPSVPNVLLVALEGSADPGADVVAVIRTLRARADARDDPYFAFRGVDGTRAFYERFLRLGAVITWSEAANGDDRASAWANPSARIPVPERSIRACLACLRAAERPPADPG